MGPGKSWKPYLATLPLAAVAWYWLAGSGVVGKPLTPTMVVDRFMERARGGTPIAPLDTGPESAAVMDLLLHSGEHTITGFEVHSDSSFTERLKSGTSCVSAKVANASGDAPVNVRLEVRNHAWKVVELSTTRRCDCPGFSDPCVMRP